MNIVANLSTVTLPGAQKQCQGGKKPLRSLIHSPDAELAALDGKDNIRIRNWVHLVAEAMGIEASDAYREWRMGGALDSADDGAGDGKLLEPKPSSSVRTTSEIPSTALTRRAAAVVRPQAGARNRLGAVRTRRCGVIQRHRQPKFGRAGSRDARILDAIQGHSPRTGAESYGEVTVKAMAAAIERFPRIVLALTRTVMSCGTERDSPTTPTRSRRCR